jgi:hypothetical protein
MAYRRHTQNRDPHWLKAFYAGKCAKCGEAFKAGDDIFYYPNGKAAYSGKCAEAAAGDFAACLADERMNGGY